MSQPPGPAAAADLVEAVRAHLAREPGPLTPHRVATALRAAGRPVGDTTVLAVHEALRRDVLGAGPLEPLLRRPGVTDVLVNGPAQVVLDRGHGLEPTGVVFPDDDAVRRLAQRLAAGAGRRLDDATPYADVRLPDGTRLHAVLSPVARPGTSISLRVPPTRAIRVDDLVAEGSLPAAGARLLRAVVASRCAFLVTGGTGSGKTTLLAGLLGLVDPAERLVLVEDSSELRPDHPHVVGLEGRPANIEGAGAVDVRTLVRQALRMRPDRLVVGEVRIPTEASSTPNGKLSSGQETPHSGRETPRRRLLRPGNSRGLMTTAGPRRSICVNATSPGVAQPMQRRPVPVPQYPLPPFPRPGRGRTVIVGADNPRFSHLPLVAGYPSGVVRLLRGEAVVMDRLSPGQRLMLCDTEPTEPHFVATNRRNRIALVPAGRRILAGLLEHRLYSEPYEPPTWNADAWEAPANVAREDVRRELCYLQDAEADGWELVENNGSEMLIDTHRPDEVLRKRDLP